MPASPNFGDIASSSNPKQTSFYEILGVSPQSSQSEIRDAYRRKSKLYHPDTAAIDKAEAATRFQALNQAYDTLRFPEKREQYDKRLATVIPRVKARSLRKTKTPSRTTTAFLDSEDRPLSAGEIFALFILGLTFLFCLLVALFLGISRGEMLVQAIPQDSSLLHQLESVKATPQQMLHQAKKSDADITPDPKSLGKTADKRLVNSRQQTQQRSLFPPM